MRIDSSNYRIARNTAITALLTGAVVMGIDGLWVHGAANAPMPWFGVISGHQLLVAVLMTLGALGWVLQSSNQRVVEAAKRNRETEQQLLTLAHAIEQSPVSLAITDTEGNIEYVSPRFSSETGYSFDEVTGKSMRLLQSGETPREVYEDLWRTITAQRNWRGELLNRTKHGELIWEEVSISPVIDRAGKTIHYVATKENITERKRQGDALKQQNAVLEQEALDRIRDLAAALEAAKAADHTKDAFLANMSHEIRTPLNAILGMTHLAREGARGRQAEYLANVAAAGKSLLGIVNSVLDLSKISAGHLELERRSFSLRKVLKETVSIHKERAREKRLELTLSVPDNVPEVVVGDELRLGQILGNLIGNAIKFTQEGWVAVSVAYAGSDDQARARLAIRVQDSGIGMSPDECDRLFQPFSQADASITRKFGGSGLGLTISKRLAVAMGGDIHVTSEKGNGSCFTTELAFPVAEASADMREADQSDCGLNLDTLCFAGVRVLVVDDQPLNQLIAQDLLQSRGVEVLLAENGQGAVDAVLGRPVHYFDMVFMDVQMPVMDGLTATQSIRAHSQFATIPIVAMTAHAFEHERRQFQDAGMTDYLGKPFAPLDLIAIVAKHVDCTKCIAGPSSVLPPVVPSGTSIEKRLVTPPEEAYRSAEYFDPMAALERFGGKRERYATWLVRFQAEFPVVVESISNALATNSLESVTRLLHTMKGQAGMLGLCELQQLAAEQEARLRHGATPALDELHTAFRLASLDIRQWLMTEPTTL